VPDVAQLRQLARLMDSVFEIPGLRTRVGLDSLLGLFPGLGDLASALVTFYILQAAADHGVSRWTMTRMAANSLIDLTVGSVPVAGDVFDVYWKANERNVELLQRHVTAQQTGSASARRSDRLFMILVIVGLLLALIGSVTVSWFLSRGLSAWLFPAVAS
jgi:hypothetical protein